MNAGGNLNRAVKDCSRPMPTRAQVGRFLQREGRKANILHDLGRVPGDAASRQVIQDAETAASDSAVERDERQNTKER
jgi:hypothetical protein